MTNRKQRRAARKMKVGDVVYAQTAINSRTGELYWFKSSSIDVPLTQWPPRECWYGPFKTDAECREHQRLTLLGPQCVVTYGGEWDPNWTKPQ